MLKFNNWMGFFLSEIKKNKSETNLWNLNMEIKT